MKNNIKRSFILFITIISTFVSCNADKDESFNADNTADLFGVWERLDSNDSVVNKFVFNEDNTGIKIHSVFQDGNIDISNAVSLEWSATDSNLSIMLDEEISTPYSFNEEGHLVLSAISDIAFIKLIE